MQNIQSAVLFLGPDRSKNGGDAKSLLSLTGDIDSFGYRKGVAYTAARLASGNEVAQAGAALGVNALPLDMNGYDAVPAAHPGQLQQLVARGINDVKVVGVGANTLDTLLEFGDAARQSGMNVSLGWVAHTIMQARHLEAVADNDIRLVTPLPRETMTVAASRIGVQDPLRFANGLDLVTIDGMPQQGFGDVELFRGEYEKFVQTGNGKAFLDHIKQGRDILPVFLNAGYDDGAGYTAMNAHESHMNGYMLASMTEIYKDPGNVVVFAMDGGPRSCIDRHDHQQDHMEMFYQGMSQKLGFAPLQIRDVFARDKPVDYRTPESIAEKAKFGGFNIHNVMVYIVAKQKELFGREITTAVIGSAEGDQLNTNLAMFRRPGLPLYLFPNTLLDKDPLGLRQATIGRMWNNGFSIVRPERPDQPTAAVYKSERIAALDFRDPVQQTLRALEIGPKIKWSFGNAVRAAQARTVMDMKLHGITPPHLVAA